MNTLLALWNFSLALCLIALLALAVLISARFVAEGKNERRSRERRRLTPFLLQQFEEPIARPMGRVESAEAVRLTIEMAELVRGSDRDLLLRNATALGVDRALIKQSHNHSPQERLVAAEALALFPQGADRVREMLADHSSEIRLGAALALAQNSAAPTPAKLVQALGLGTTERSLLIISLMRDLVETDARGVEAMLQAPVVPNAAKMAAIDALAASGRVEQAPLVDWMVEAATQETDLLPRILRALGRIGHPGGHSTILAALDHPSWEVRTTASEAAGRAGVRNAVERLGELLADDQWWVRLRAGEALTKLGAAGRETLARIVETGSSRAATAARTIMAERGVDVRAS